METGLTRTVSTNANGNYAIILLPVGAYELTVSAPGMQTAKDSRVTVQLGQNTVANFTLDAAGRARPSKSLPLARPWRRTSTP